MRSSAVAMADEARPVVWMRAVRDAAPRFTTSRLTVLLCLALRMHKSGVGFASARILGEDASVAERTARRATDEACSRGYLNRTRRGHRLGNGSAIASEWKLIVPGEATPQPDTGVRLSETSTGQSEHLNRTGATPQPDTGVRPRGPLQEVFSKQPREVQIVIDKTDADEDEAIAVVDLIRRERAPHNLPGLVDAIARSEELAKWLERVRAERVKVARSNAIAAAKKAPPCEHLVPGGDALHPDSNEPFCVDCRVAFRRARLTAQVHKPSPKEKSR
jgi:hypothetical protein